MTPAEYELACEHVDDALAKLCIEHPDKVVQAKANPKLQGWFVGQVRKALNWRGPNDIIEMCVRGTFADEQEVTRPEGTKR